MKRLEGLGKTYGDFKEVPNHLTMKERVYFGLNSATGHRILSRSKEKDKNEDKDKHTLFSLEGVSPFGSGFGDEPLSVDEKLRRSGR